MTDVDVDLNVNLNATVDVDVDTNTRNGVSKLGRDDARRRSDADAFTIRVASSPVDVKVNGGVQVQVHVKVNVGTRRASSLLAIGEAASPNGGTV